MNLLLFTHKIDIDGMGSAVLAKLVFDSHEIVFCDTFEIDEKLNEYYENGKLFEFDKIYVTDLCPSTKMLEKINLDEKLKTKLKVFDHHATDSEKTNFDFVQIKVKDEMGLCCGTSLFLKELEEGFCFSPTAAVLTFVELTRRYDTWEWKTIYNDELPNDLNTLFGSLKTEKYVLTMTQKLKNATSFEFSEEELTYIKNRKNQIQDACKQLESKMEIKLFESFKAGVVHNSVGELRNEFAEYLKTANHGIDIMIMINHDRKTVSVRSINPDADVRNLVIKFGGKAHKNSGGFPLSNKFLTELESCYTLPKV